MTEQEALDKWCPFVRFTGVNGTGVIASSRGIQHLEVIRGESLDQVKCVGSGCMAWGERKDGTGGWCRLAG